MGSRPAAYLEQCCDGGGLARFGSVASLWGALQPLRQPDPPLGLRRAEAPLRQADQRRTCRTPGDERGRRGSDVVSMKLSRPRPGDGYVLHGTSSGSHNAPLRRYRWSMPRPIGGRRAGITAFLVEKGRRLQRLTEMTRGGCADPTPASGVRRTARSPGRERTWVPENGGVGVLMSGRTMSAHVMAAGPLGSCRHCLSTWCGPDVRERKQCRPGDRLIPADLQGKVADDGCRAESAAPTSTPRPSLRKPAWRPASDAAGAILMAAENAVKVSLEAISGPLGGGRRLHQELPVERLCATPSLDLGAGTTRSAAS